MIHCACHSTDANQVIGISTRFTFATRRFDEVVIVSGGLQNSLAEDATVYIDVSITVLGSLDNRKSFADVASLHGLW